MQLFGVLCLVGGYCCWYTLYTRTWGDGSGFLYNLTGSTRWGGAPDTSGGGGGGSTQNPKVPGPSGQQPGGTAGQIGQGGRTGFKGS